MRFIAFGDLMGRADLTRNVVSNVHPNNEFLLFTGDIPNPEIFKVLREQKVLSGEKRKSELKDEIESDELLESIFDQVREISKIFIEMAKDFDIYAVLGNADLRKFLPVIPNEKTVKMLHKKVVQVSDHYIVGYNGRPLYKFEDENLDENAFSEKEIYKDISALLGRLDNQKVILVTHSPPYEILDQVKPKYIEYAIGTYGKSAKEGRIGSEGLRKVVEEFKPKLHIFGHVHECKGVHIGDHTVFINTGSLGEDNEYVDISLSDKSIDVIYRHF